MRRIPFFKIGKHRFLLMVLLSLLLHNIGLITYHLYTPKSELAENDERKVMRIDHISAEQLKSIKEKWVQKSERKKETPPQQVVNNTNDGELKKPDKSRFLGEKNQTFDKQTLAPRIGSFNEGGDGKKKAVVEEKQDPIQQKMEKRKLTMDDLQFHNFSGLEQKRVKEQKQIKIEDVKIGSGGKGVGVAQNNDFIEDVPLGALTHLNTTEFKFWGFYNRIRLQLEQYWGVTLKDKAERMWRSGKRLSADQNYITRLKIVLDARGNILKVNVVGQSGAFELDEAAIESFQKAGPFPNPPKDMISNEGFAILEWGFVVKS